MFKNSKGPHDRNTSMRLKGRVSWMPIPIISNDQRNVEIGSAMIGASSGRNRPALCKEKGIRDTKRPVTISECTSTSRAKHPRRRHLRPAERFEPPAPAQESPQSGPGLLCSASGSSSEGSTKRHNITNTFDSDQGDTFGDFTGDGVTRSSANILFVRKLHANINDACRKRRNRPDMIIH